MIITKAGQVTIGPDGGVEVTGFTFADGVTMYDGAFAAVEWAEQQLRLYARAIKQFSQATGAQVATEAATSNQIAT